MGVIKCLGVPPVSWPAGWLEVFKHLNKVYWLIHWVQSLGRFLLIHGSKLMLANLQNASYFDNLRVRKTSTTKRLWVRVMQISQTFALLIYVSTKGLSKWEMFGDQTLSNIVWWYTKHFTIWPPCLVLFESHQIFDQTTQNISFVLVFDGQHFVHLDSCIKHVWHAHAYQSQPLSVLYLQTQNSKLKNCLLYTC